MKNKDADDGSKNERKQDKKHKLNTWPLKACLITFILAFAVNAASELVLDEAHLVFAIVLTFAIVALGVLFDIIGTASTSCNIEPYLSMASRKVKGAKTAVKLAQNSDVVSSICNDIVGDVCGIVSGVCAATIAGQVYEGNFFVAVIIYAIISTLTITAKAIGKGFAVSKANDIIFFVSKIISVFGKED